MAVTPASTPAPIPAPPGPPRSWTSVPDLLTYATAMALWVVGLLTSLGVVLPAHTSAEVSLWAGVAQQMGAVAGAVAALVSHHSVVKAKLGSTWPPR